MPSQGSGKSGEERVARGARPKMGTSSIGHGAKGKKVKEGSEEGGTSGRGQEEMRRVDLMARKRELEEERGRIKARLDMLEEVKREVLRRKKDQRKEGSEREKVEGLLVEYQTCFSTGDFDIGRTTLVKRSIDTGDTALIRQRKEEEVKEQERRALEKEQHENEKEAKEQFGRKGE